MKITIELNKNQTTANVRFEKDGEEISWLFLSDDEKQKIVHTLEVAATSYKRGLK